MFNRFWHAFRAMFRRADVFDNQLLGGKHDMTISARVGLSIKNRGWASHVPWPASWRKHFASAASAWP
jgi:hypothetical protein